MHPHFPPKFGGGSASYSPKNMVHAQNILLESRGHIVEQDHILAFIVEETNVSYHTKNAQVQL